jgi:bacterioferritin-associated ferredoxin
MGLMTPTPDPKPFVICRCSGTTDAQIQRLLARGIDTLEDISQATGAVSGCGGCETDILDLLAQIKPVIGVN